MKPILIATALALGLVTAAQAVPGNDRGARSEERAHKRLAHLTTTLNLTDAQQRQIKALMDEQRDARRDLFRRHQDERQALRETHQGKLDQILSAEQRTTLAALRAEQHQRFEGKRHGRPGHRGKRGGPDATTD